MAVYKIFPTRDASLYSAYPNMNTGDDAILEVSNTSPDINPSPRVARAILDFNQNEINTVINNIIGSGSAYRSYLKLFVAEANGINQDTTLELRILTGSWNNGSGKYLDTPQSTDGVSWNYRLSSGSGAWNTSGGDLDEVFLSTKQTFDLRTIKDFTVDASNIIDAIYYDDGVDYTDSLMVKLTGSQEFVSGSANQPSFKFFSVDTNTIYPPVLEFRWDDFTTSSEAPSEITTSDLQVALDENPGIFYSESINRFRLNVRPTYPVRTFQTASLYTTNHSLPVASYYAIKDLDTNEYVVDFDTTYTKISNDNNGSYFDIYMNGLEPERYYKILIQTTVDGSTMVKDEDYIFKVVNG
jgi:hypothetical protein